MKREFTKISDGEWVQPVHRGYRMMCCDCGLVHKIDFKVVDFKGRKKVRFRAYRDMAATAGFRRRKVK